ncbi:MAG TPA: hypothetical protein VM029_00235, partial [Opitutaceae bacterium]|nr:hypothetical protein [Opitutaceae bacterium]
MNASRNIAGAVSPRRRMLAFACRSPGALASVLDAASFDAKPAPAVYSEIICSMFDALMSR